MPYKYVAYTERREVVEGTIDVGTEDLAKQALSQLGYNVLSLKATNPRLTFRQSMPGIFGVKTRDVIVFSRQLATLIERGVNSFSAIKMLRDQTRNPLLQEAISTVIQDLQQGASLSAAFSRHPQIFPPLYSRMVAIGEKTGNLDSVLRQAAEYIEKEKAALARVTKAMVYPAFILAVACAVVVILMVFTLPPLLGMFEEFEADLPAITSLFIGITQLASAYKFQVLAVLAVGAVAALWYVRTSAGRFRFDSLLLRTPGVGKIATLREMAHISRTMAVALDSGIPATDGLDMVVQTTRNAAVRRGVEDVRQQVVQGRGLFGAMAINPVFPPLIVQMVRVGEEVGTLSSDLKAVADIYEQEVDDRVETMLALLQPCLLLAMGAIVAFIAISVIVPIYTIMGSI